MTLFPRRRSLGPKREDIMPRDLVGIFLWFLLVSLSIEFALKWPGAAAASATLSESSTKNYSPVVDPEPGLLVVGATPPKYFYSYLKITAANYSPNSRNVDDTARSNDGDWNVQGNSTSEPEEARKIIDYPAAMVEVIKTQPIEKSEKQTFSGKYNSIYGAEDAISPSVPEGDVPSESDLEPWQPRKWMTSMTDFTKKRMRRAKKNDVKHVLKVTYDFIHPRIMTPITAFTRTHKRDSDYHSQSESLKIEPQIFDHETPAVNFNYNDVKFHESDHVPCHKRTEESIDGAEHPSSGNNTASEVLEDGTKATQASTGVPSELSSDNNDMVAPSIGSNIQDKTPGSVTATNGKPAALSDSKGTPRSSDPETDALHMTTVTFDPAAIVTIPPGQFDTMDFDVPGEPLTPEDYQKAALAEDEPIDTSRQVDPTTTAEQFEGDIKLVEDDKPINKTALHGLPSFRSGIVSSERLWPNGNVPYVLSSTFRPEERSIIAKAIKTLHDLSCVHLVPHTNERDYIHILKGDGCTSNIGRVGGSQALSLGPGCIKAGVVMHELMHALGFWHEQSRFDRDRYININWDNIQKGKGYNFQKYDFKGLQHVGTQYDFESLMHYSPYAFAKNRSVPTVEPKEGQHEVGQRRGLSSNDLHRLMELYPCPNATSPANFPNVHLPTATLPPPVPGLCLDSDKHCAKWAQEGQCVENPAWMMLHCRQSCNRCAESKCVDLNDKCALWKADGQCEVNAPYMHLYCSKSCQLCSGTETTSGDCANSNKKCGLWASQGDCVRYPGYMNRYCRKSCLQC